MAATAHPTTYDHLSRHLPQDLPRQLPHGRPARPNLRLIPGGRIDTVPSVPVTTARANRELRDSERTRVSRGVERRRALRIALIGAVCWLVLLGAGLAGASRGDAGTASSDAVSHTVDAGR